VLRPENILNVASKWRPVGYILPANGGQWDEILLAFPADFAELLS
jgi:hypothetical protein